MRERISKEMLAYRIEWLNKALERPVVTWIFDGERNHAQVGRFTLDKYNGFAVEEIVNESGGVSHPFGMQRQNARATLAMLDAILAAIEITRKQDTKQKP